ncbi:MAG: nucleotide exchange factor GrpE, partial [Alphaproteobacteria bacterium]|nr:nucleotide exchange factor GrpE [Alphaproteobacteria bacterium]
PETDQVPEAETPANAVAEAQEAESPAPVAPADAPDPDAVIQDLRDKLLRAMAETENTRRIAAREKADAAKYGVTNFARDMMRVADNLTMAMMTVTDDARAADPNLNNLCVGIDMTMKELLNAFEGHGIRPIPAKGQPFDHNVHEAVQQIEDKSVPNNTVVQVIRGGFTIQDRLLRPAQVIVSTGGPKAEAQPASATSAPSAPSDPTAPGQAIDSEV